MGWERMEGVGGSRVETAHHSTRCSTAWLWPPLSRMYLFASSLRSPPIPATQKDKRWNEGSGSEADETILVLTWPHASFRTERSLRLHDLQGGLERLGVQPCEETRARTSQRTPARHLAQGSR